MYHCEMQFNYKLINFCAIRETNTFIYIYCVMIFDFNAYSFNVFIIWDGKVKLSMVDIVGNRELGTGLGIRGSTDDV